MSLQGHTVIATSLLIDAENSGADSIANATDCELLSAVFVKLQMVIALHDASKPAKKSDADHFIAGDSDR